MIRDEGWLDLVEVNPISPNSLSDVRKHLSCDASGVGYDAVHIFCSREGDDGGDDNTMIPLTSIVAETFISSGVEVQDKNDDDAIPESRNDEPSPSYLLRIHPVLLFFLHHASTSNKVARRVRSTEDNVLQPSVSSSLENSTACGARGNASRIQIAPLPMLEFKSFQSMSQSQQEQMSPDLSWKCCPVKVEMLKKGSHIFLSCVYVEKEEPWSAYRKNGETKGNHQMSKDQIISMAVEGRLVKAGSVILLSTIHGAVIACITNIIAQGEEGKMSSTITNEESNFFPTYRLSDDVFGDYECHVEGPLIHSANELRRTDLYLDNERNAWEQDIPGYELLLKEIVNIFRINGDAAAASGVLLTGCAGVGKSRLASCVARQYSDRGSFEAPSNSPTMFSMVSKLFPIRSSGGQDVYYSSIQDLIFQASFETNLLENVLVPKLKGCKLWIIDDLNLLEIGEGSGDEGRNDNETIMVQNAVIDAIDRFHLSCCILGVAQSDTNLPPELTKSGRLEKSLQMLQPTQMQRIEIWKRILSDGCNDQPLLGMSRGDNRDWLVALASSTAGCVPKDLLRIYRDAKTKVQARLRESDNCDRNLPELEWEDLREAIKVAIPSQLSELDVTKPKLFEDGISWKEIHLQSWQDFAGYPSLKKSVYRQVVVPWRYFLQSIDDSPSCEMEESKKAWLEPPPGVLFHGVSGTGKSVAAKCLAVSLGLPIIQVRATDLLDKWLGGSESLLRSLFTRARAVSPCVLFLDEIDSIACNREEDDNNDVSSRILSTLLNEMDGVSSAIQKSRVLVIACTNRIKKIDSALLRPGRLQEHFHMSRPDAFDVEEILKLRMGKIPMASSLNLKHLSSSLSENESTGADVEGLCREATFNAMRRVASFNDSDVTVTQDDFESAIVERFGSGR